MTNIIDLFFDSVAKEASSGRVNCGMMYNVLFETKINGKYLYKSPDDIKNNKSLFIPTLEINNMEEFNNALINYYNKAKEFYKNTIDQEDDFDKTIITLLWNNATEEDFKSPVNYINKYISFLDKPLDIGVFPENLGFSEILESDIKVALIPEPVYQETPYALYVTSMNGDLYYNFPVVRFGIYDDTAYVYAVQQLMESDGIPEEERYKKKIHRKLFKVNENFEKEDEIDNITNPENLTGINPSALVSLSILFSKLEDLGIKKIEVPLFLTVRYNAKEISFLVRKDILRRRGYSEEDIENTFNDLTIKHEEIQRNLSDKFLRNIRRLEYSFNNIEVVSYPMELDTKTHINLSEYEYSNNPLLKELYEIGKSKTYKKQ